jgi:TetR/AcrR family transcriptional regulator, regulator of biofilm formation and stress response
VLRSVGNLSRNLTIVKFGIRHGCWCRVTVVVNRPRPTYGQARDALLGAAVRTVAQLGLRGLTYRAVAAEAGVSYAAVTHHFGSREALIAEALDRSARRADQLSSLEPETGRIEDFVRDLLTVVEEAQDAHAFQFELALESRRDPKLRSTVHDLYRVYQQAIGRELSRIGFEEDAALARLVFAALDGLVLQLVVGISTRSEVEQSLERLRQTLSVLEKAGQNRSR